MSEGHLHHMLLEQRGGIDYLTLQFAAGLRDGCGRRIPKEAAPSYLRYPTPIAATADIVRAFNQGDSSWLRNDPTAREARQNLLQFMGEQSPSDGRWALMADDLRRYAALPLCTP